MEQELIRHPHLLAYASELRADRDIVLAAVSERGTVLYYASTDLQEDREVVLAAVSQDGMALRYASEDLCADREIVLAAVSSCGCALRYASEDLCADREIVLAAVNTDGAALAKASEELRADREIVLAAVKNRWSSLRVAEESLRNDPLVVSEAFRRSKGHRPARQIPIDVPMGQELKKRIGDLLRRLETEQDILFVDDSSILEYHFKWKQSTWHKIWLVHQLGDSGLDACGRLITEQAGFLSELWYANELLYWAPVIGAVTCLGKDWRCLEHYRIGN